ncbi:MAG: hypothetical protein U1F98_04620 [Verrucomicrobiota bacterium]
MTQHEQQEFDHLRSELTAATERADRAKMIFTKAACRLTEELKLYRGLFWCLLAFITLVVIMRFLQR